MSENNQDLQEKFRQAMRRMVSTVSIITATYEREPLGMTATSVTCVSFEPLSMLVCVHKKSKFHEVIANSRHFCINLLHKNQQKISNHFSTPGSGETQFSCGAWEQKNDLHYLRDAQANLFLTVENTRSFGTHGLFIGTVFDIEYTEDIAPLLYANGHYGEVKNAS
ncbi:MAG: flavin reductase [Emcibacter sp.]|nr:flavin reductase [Emcibacter sp.]